MTKATKTKTAKKKNESKQAASNPLMQLKTALSTTGDLLPIVKQKDWALSTMAKLSTLIEQDVAGSRQQAVLGELYYKILGLPVEKQKELTGAWAAAQKIAAPTYEQTGVGRPTTGRKELAAVLYAGHPEMLVKEDDNNDTAAGRRISQCILVYKYEAGLATRPERLIGPTLTRKISTNAMRQQFGMLYGLTRTADEQESLILLYRRAGVTGKELDKWMSSAKDDITEIAVTTVSVPPAAAEERRA